MSKGPKILFIDIETSPIEAYVWQLWDVTVGLNQIRKDWKLISFAAKWSDEKKVIQYDLEDYPEKRLAAYAWYLLDSADIVVTQNGKHFDIPKLNAKFVEFGLRPPSSFQHIDTYKLAKKHFGFTSNKLEYMSKLLCKTKKSDHKSFPGFELWEQCMKGNPKAWKEMRKYNIQDVLTLEELYRKLIPWENLNFNNYYVDLKTAVCSCGHRKFSKNGHSYTPNGKFPRFECKKCGSELKKSKTGKYSGVKR